MATRGTACRRCPYPAQGEEEGGGWVLRKNVVEMVVAGGGFVCNKNSWLRCHDQRMAARSDRRG